MNRGTVLLALLTMSVTAFLLAPKQTLAWGSNGHRIVARIGEHHLSPAACAGVKRIAGAESLALLATWPDFIRSYPAWDCVKPWHFLTVEDGQTLEEGLARPADIPRACDDEAFTRLDMPDNVVAAIDYFSAIVGGDEEKANAFEALLQESGVAPYRGSTRLTALILVVHFVGDVHQPLHVGRGDDRGGNSITTQWFGELTKLHSLWDSGLIDKLDLSFSELASFLEQEFAGQPVDHGSGPTTWARESVSYREQVYAIGDERNPAANLPNLSYEYAATHEALLKKRLYQGGRRLAWLLNSIFEETPVRDADAPEAMAVATPCTF